jgi:hypothetical protein
MKNLKICLFILTAIIVVLTSCRQKHKKTKTVNDTLKIEFGKVNLNIPCMKDGSVTYCIYVPSAYEHGKNMPVIYAFDPHADGKLPVNLLKDEAERFGYIIVGSNNSRNGLDWESNSKMIDILMDDINMKFSIDKRRIYTMGFSGGSRVASLVAITKGGVNGVIGCGAGFPELNQPIEKKFNYLGLVGNTDFNMLEMKKLDDDLTNMGFRHHIEIFKGKHEWPPTSMIPDIFTWLEFNATRDNLIARKDTLLINSLLRCQKQLETFNRQKDLYGEYLMYKKIISYFDQLTDISEYQKMVKEMETSNALKKILKKNANLEKKELELQQYYTEAMQTKDTIWWGMEIKKIKLKDADPSIIEESLMLKRVLNYLSMVAYMNSSGALNAFKTEEAAKYIKIYGMVDPPNPDHFYFEACQYSVNNLPDKALIALDSAISRGFKDKNKLVKESMLDNIKGTAKFQELVREMK